VCQRNSARSGTRRRYRSGRNRPDSTRPGARTELLGPPWDSVCELVGGGAEAEVQDAAGGVLVSFATAPSHAEHVEARLDTLAAGLADGLDRELPRVEAEVVATGDGAQLLLTAAAQRVSDLRTLVRSRVDRLAGGGCPPPAPGEEPNLPPSFRKPPEPSHGGGHAH
jgi:hypothetical protein